MDTVTKTKRSEIMSKVRHGNTEAELFLRKQLQPKHKKGFVR